MGLYDNDAPNAWSTVPTSSTPRPEARVESDPPVSDPVQKEAVIKDIVQLRDGLRGLLVRITESEGDTDKLRKDNEFLATYIDNLTRNTVVAAGQKR